MSNTAHLVIRFRATVSLSGSSCPMSIAAQEPEIHSAINRLSPSPAQQTYSIWNQHISGRFFLILGYILSTGLSYMYPWNHLRGGWAIHEWPIMDTLVENLINGNYNVYYEIIWGGWAIHGWPIMDTLGEGLMNATTMNATTMNPWVHLYPWNHLRALSYPWMTNHGYLSGESYECNYNESMGTFVSMKSFEWVELSMDVQSWIPWGGVSWMATTMYPWVTMDTFVVHNTSPADSCKLNREGTPWSSRTLKTTAVQAPF